MDETTRYREIDLPFYHDSVAPVLPPEVLDFHAHTWLSDHWRELPWQADGTGGKYMVVEPRYPKERLAADGARLFPDRPYNAMCFGYPTPAADLDATNAYTAEAGHQRGLFPLMVVGRGSWPSEELERRIVEGGFFGYKVLLNWYGDDYGNVTIDNMAGPDEMRVADALSLIVLLHVPRSGRLADPVIQRGVAELARAYPKARIVLAHCGRCYLPDQMRAAAPFLGDLPNVFVDTSMVMDPLALQILFEHVDASRVLFGTDLPVAAMRGRRVYVMDHWVDVVLEGYPPSAYRVASDDIRATFMAWEIVLAVRRAGEAAGLTEGRIRDIFYANGMNLLRGVMEGQRLGPGAMS